MFLDILEVNDYSIIVDTTEIIPPLITATHEAKVTKIFDHINNIEVLVTIENTCLTMGKTKKEAYDKSQELARQWAETQR